MRTLAEPAAESGVGVRGSNCLDPFTTWLLVATVSLGVIVLWEGSTGWIPALAILSVMSSVGTMIRTWRATRDALNPIIVVVVIAAVRFGMPAILASFGSHLDDLSIVRLLRLERQDWLFGYSMAATGVAALLLGWQVSALTRSSGIPSSTRLRWQLSSPLWVPTLAAAVGFLALVAFVVTNGISFVTAAQTGVFRATEIREGTGVFFWLSFLLIVGSVVAVHTCLARTAESDRLPLSTFAPVLLSTMAFFVLGGRARAFVPVAAAFLLWWYRPSREQLTRKTSFSGGSLKGKKVLLVCAPLAMITFSYVGINYRGTDAVAGRESSSSANVEDFGRYLAGTFAIDAGALHSLAVASKLPPGVLGGKGFVANLTFPVSEFVSIPGKSTGVYLVQRLTGRSARKWGFSATIIGEAYVNYGLLGLILVPGLIGFIFERLYGRFCSGRTSILVYALLSIYLVRVVFESVEKWPEALVVLAMLWAITRFGHGGSAQGQDGAPEAAR